MTLAIVIVTWNNRDDVRACLGSLGDLPPEWQLWLVDNASTDGTTDLVRAEFPHVRLITNIENVGFARANNQVIEQTDTDFVLLLNPDTECGASAIHAALREMEAHPEAGVVAVQLRGSDGSLQPSCARFPRVLLNFLQVSELAALLPRSVRSRLLLSTWWEHDEPRTVDWVTGAFLLVRRAAIRAAGMLSPEYFLYYEEVEWCYRIRQAGHTVRFTPAARIIHHGNRSAAQVPTAWRLEQHYRGKYAFCRHHYGAFVARLMQLSDLLGWKFRGWRYSFRRLPDPAADNCRREWVTLALAAVRRELQMTVDR
jgi:hypothetical protein